MQACGTVGPPQTDLIHAPQHSPPTNRLCQYAHHGLLRAYGPPRLQITRCEGAPRRGYGARTALRTQRHGRRYIDLETLREGRAKATNEVPLLVREITGIGRSSEGH